MKKIFEEIKKRLIGGQENEITEYNRNETFDDYDYNPKESLFLEIHDNALINFGIRRGDFVEFKTDVNINDF